MQTSTTRRPLPDPRGSQSLFAAVVLVVAAALLAAVPAAGGASAQPRATIIGDSIMASFDYVPAARRSLAKGLVLRSDSAVCRRLVAASCPFQGSTPETALDVVRADGRALGRVVVINVGYNDWSAVYDVDRVLTALRTASVESVIWVTLREAGPNAKLYAQSNALIRTAERRWRSPWWRTGMPTVAAGRGSVATACTSRRPARWASLDSCVHSCSPARPRSRPSTAPVENSMNFALAARVSGWTTHVDLSTGRPPSGITSERMFCSPCTGAVALSCWTRPSGTA